MEATVYGAIVLAGGDARRMGGARKPAVRVGGVPMIERVLAAVTPAGAPLVVGPSDLVLPPEVAVIQEAPPGGGPAAAVAAAFAASPGPLAPIVAIVAGDLPLLTVEAVRALLDAAGASGVDGAVYVDAEGRPQWLCGAWRSQALAARIAALATDHDQPGLAGVALRQLFGPLTVARLPARAPAAPAVSAGKPPPTGSTGHTAPDPGTGGSAGPAAVRAGESPPTDSTGRTPPDRSTGGAAEPAGERADDLPPWFDCDTEDDIRRAEEWLTR